MNDTQIVVSLLEHQISRSRSEFSAMQPVVDAIVRKLIVYFTRRRFHRFTSLSPKSNTCTVRDVTACVE